MNTNHNKNLPPPSPPPPVITKHNHGQVVLRGYKICMSAYIPRQLAASWDTFKIYLSKGFPSCRIGLRTQNSNKYIKTIMEKEKYKKLNI